MSVDLSLPAVSEDLVTVAWPALACFAGAQVAVVRRVMQGTGPPDLRLTVVAWVTACTAGGAVAVDVMFAPLPGYEPGFSRAALVWPLLVTTMWPVLLVFAVAELLLIVRPGFRSRGLITGVVLAAGLTASWMMGWCIYLTPHSEPLLESLLRWPWMLGSIACSFGFALSTATWLSASRVTAAKQPP